MIKNIAIFILVVSGAVNAQVNTEKFRTPEKFNGIAGYLELSGTVKTGNSEKTEGNVDGRLDWKSGNTTTFFIFESEHEWINGDRFSNLGLFHIRNIIQLSERFKSEIFGQINYDKNLLINNRELAGAGIRTMLFHTESSDAAFGTAYMFEHEKYDLPKNSSHESNITTSRWSNYLSLFIKINEVLNFGGVVYFQPMFSDFEDYRILNENRLNIILSEMFSFSVDFKIRHDSLPPGGIKKTDTKMNFGVRFRF